MLMLDCRPSARWSEMRGPARLSQAFSRFVNFRAVRRAREARCMTRKIASQEQGF
jgi:hypothetical protein